MKVLAKMLLVGATLAAFFWRDSFDAGSLRGARVLVTGASTGIGEQLAYCYARLGAQVVITARRENVLQQVSVLAARRLGAQKALYVTGDMATTSDPSRVVKFAVDELGGLDYLVLNHIGRYSFSPWSGDVNFLSYVQLASAALPSLEKSKGSIVVVSSLLGEFPTPFTAPYTATKFAVNGFFCTLQHELAMRSSDVSLTISILGLVDTESAMEKVSRRGGSARRSRREPPPEGVLLPLVHPPGLPRQRLVSVLPRCHYPQLLLLGTRGRRRATTRGRPGAAGTVGTVGMVERCTGAPMNP
uniref:Hydroxysteroid 11-beta dehydrogenase 1 like n=1 Tax=Scleropages formosus TaxID=113540 RepID=A0A8C9TDI1_SCLFO